MTTAIGSVVQNVLLGDQGKPSSGNSPGDALHSFGDLLKKEMNNINQLQQNASKAVQTFAVGGPIETHQVMIALEKAGNALQMAVQVRNKLVQAYQELSHISV
jgi:flagellar hook-basal body complex protein FliE